MGDSAVVVNSARDMEAFACHLVKAACRVVADVQCAVAKLQRRVSVNECASGGMFTSARIMRGARKLRQLAEMRTGGTGCRSSAGQELFRLGDEQTRETALRFMPPGTGCGASLHAEFLENIFGMFMSRARTAT